MAAAQKAAFLGRRTVVVDDASCGVYDLDLAFGAPTGLFSKALRDTAKSLNIDVLRSMGVVDDVIWQQVLANVSRLAANNATTALEIISELKVHYLRGRASLESAGSVVSVVLPDKTEMRLSASRVLVATGSSPTRVPSVPFDDVRIFDSDSIARLGFLPTSVGIAGAGIIAIEYAMIFAKLRCDVTMLVRGEARSSLQRIGLDGDIAQGLLDSLAEAGVTVLTQTSTSGFDVPEDRAGRLKVHLKGSGADGAPPPPECLECDIFLAAMGRKPSTAGLGLAEAGATVDEKSAVLKVDSKTFQAVGCNTVFGETRLLCTNSLID